ncbi:MAG TPA: hypothetical protein VMF91_25605 [Bryobacteraceae bacterium]|nr:hypothetical protein [Bryobacteraceae bacterium]
MNTELSDYPNGASQQIEVPAPTAWPIVLASGLTLIAAGMVTAASVSILGAVIAVAGAVGWFRSVLPEESHELVPVIPQEIRLQTSRVTVERIANISALPRTWLPVEIYPISAGIKGGLAAGAVMALLACLYGILHGNGFWYAMNLLVAGVFPDMATETSRQLGTFRFHALLVAVPVHLLISLMVGLVYGAMLPMVPRRPILLGGFIAPLLWSGIIWGGLAFINPVMNERIDWLWFVLCQIAFGVVAGLVVMVQERIPTRQNVPLLVRLGIEAPGLMQEHEEE